MNNVEKALLIVLKLKYPGVASVKILELTQGSVKVKFVVTFKQGNSTLPTKAKLGSDISTAVASNQLSSIGATSSGTTLASTGL